MNQSSSDPRTPFAIGIIVIGAVLLAGIVWAVLSAPSSNGLNGVSDPNLTFNDANDPTVGPADAKVTVRIFGDLECPACRAAEPGVAHLREAYANTVRIVWNDFPLPASIHPKARIAANAARCAEEQGKFWEMHDALYDLQDGWSKSTNPADDFFAMAQRLQLNEDGFRSCYDSRRHDGKITDDTSEGRANGVDATPTFFVNNVKQVGILSPSEWDAILKPLLEGSVSAAPDVAQTSAAPADAQ
jgi:protein-disulfide isomerase